MLINVIMINFSICLVIIIRSGKWDTIYCKETAWISHGLELICVLGIAMSKSELWNGHLQTANQLSYKIVSIKIPNTNVFVGILRCHLCVSSIFHTIPLYA